MSDFMKPQMQEYGAPHLNQATDWFQNQQNKPTPQTQAPDTPYSQQAAQRADQSVGQYGPDMEKFLYGMMMGGGSQNVDKLMADMNSKQDMDKQNTMNQIKSSGLPMQSSAMGRAVGQGLGQVDASANLAMGDLRRQMMESSMGRQFQGAQGLSGMPSYYGQPSSIEQAIMGMQLPYDQMNLQAQQNKDNMMANWMTQLGMYQPERMQEPSGFNQYVSPILNPLLQGAGQSLPFMLSGEKE